MSQTKRSSNKVVKKKEISTLQDAKEWDKFLMGLYSRILQVDPPLTPTNETLLDFLDLLHENTVFEIAKYLPISTLFLVRQVSKSWCQKLSHPFM